MAFSKIIAESMDLTDAYNFTGTLQQNGASIGGTNTPAFAAYLNASSHDPAANTWTRINMYGEDLDSHSAYDTSNARFTIPSGHAGKYAFGAVARLNNSHTARVLLYIYKNGTGWLECEMREKHGSGTTLTSIYNQGVIDAAVGDYFELYMYNDGDTTGYRGSSSATSARETWWFGYKLIGA